MTHRKPLFNLDGTAYQEVPTGDTIGACMLVQRTGRVYSYSDARWVSDADDNYGPDYHNWNENCGTNADPNTEYENMGTFMPAGTILHKMWMYGRGNDTTNSPDFEYILGQVIPATTTEWTSVGHNTDTDVNMTTLVRDSWMTPTTTLGGSAQPFTNGIGRQYLREYDLNLTASQDCQLSMYFKPSRPTTNTGTDYFRITRIYLFEYPLIGA